MRTNDDKKIDELVAFLDAFAAEGGGRVRVTGGEGELIAERVDCLPGSPCAVPNLPEKENDK